MIKVAGVIICLICVFTAAAQTDRAGTITKISRTEVIVKNEDPSAPFMVGERLKLLTGDKSLVLEVIFPFQTSSRCRVIAGSVNSLKIGAIVYSGGLPDKNSNKDTPAVKGNSRGTNDPRIKTRLESGHRYFLTKSLTWDEAEKEAVAAGGHLVTVNDSEEESWLRETFGKTEFFWIGLMKKGWNEWGWVSGEESEFRNWSETRTTDQNNTSGDNAIMNFASSIAGAEAFGDAWRRAKKYEKHRGIIEIQN